MTLNRSACSLRQSRSRCPSKPRLPRRPASSRGLASPRPNRVRRRGRVDADPKSWADRPILWYGRIILPVARPGLAIHGAGRSKSANRIMICRAEASLRLHVDDEFDRSIDDGDGKLDYGGAPLPSEMDEAVLDPASLKQLLECSGEPDRHSRRARPLSRRAPARQRQAAALRAVPNFDLVWCGREASNSMFAVVRVYPACPWRSR